MREKIPKTESPSKRQFKDNETAEDVREKAMVCLKRPRNAIQTKEELLQNVIESLVDFLREKTAADREIKQQKSKLRAKQQEQEGQQQMMKAMMI